METAVAMLDDEGRALPKEWTRGIVGFLALAVVLRLVRTLQNYPMWCDETMLAANLLDRNWTELAIPLAYRQVCPLGFLAIEWLAVRILGFTEFSLRLFPLICALVSVPLFFGFARSVLGRATAATFLAVGVFAVSEPLIRYAGEAKPYEADLMMSLALLCLCVNWLRAPGEAKHLWLFAAAIPLAVAVSLTSLFMIGATGIIGLVHLLAKRHTVRAAVAWAVSGPLIVAGTSIAAMAGLGQYRTPPADRPYFLKFWAAAFPPPLREPAALARWLVRAHTGPLFAFPHGGDTRLAWLTPVIFGCFVLGAVVLCASRRRSSHCCCFRFCSRCWRPRSSDIRTG